MNSAEKTLNDFSTRVRQMILHYSKMKKENNNLHELIEERDSRIKQLEARLAQAENDYNSLKTAKMIEISDSDMDGAKKRLAKLIRDVSKCITLLSEK